MAIPLEPPRPRYWTVLAAVAAVIICFAVAAKALEPQWISDLYGLTEITDIWLEDSAKDGCWPNPKITENLVIARADATVNRRLPPALLGPCLCATGVEMTLPELGPGMTTGMLKSLIKGIEKGAKTN